MSQLTQLRLPLCALAASLALVGCSLTPHYERPAAPIPTQWAQPHLQPTNPEDADTSLDWRLFVTDAALREQIQIALDNNRDLRQTLLNIEAARAQYRIQRSDQIPGFNAQGNSTRQRLPGDLANADSARIQENHQVGIGLTEFELDLFGRMRSLSQAALEEYLATEEAARTAQISLVAEVIQAYLMRDGASRRHQLTQETLASRETSLQLVSHRRQAGTATALDYQEAVGLTEQARVALERTSRELQQAGNALTLLLGVSQADTLPPPRGSSVLLQQTLVAGAPSSLLIQRPDIRGAEHQLRARNASIGAARAAFFPRISLTGLFGSASADLSNLFSAGQRAWSFAPQLTLPIFDGGHNAANLDLAKVRKDQAVAHYEQTIQTAFREVSDALVATDTLKREEASQRALAESGQQALRLAEARYRAGVDDYLRYLDTQRSNFTYQTTLIEVETQRQIALVGLFKALGGGWDESARAPADDHSRPTAP